MSEQQPPVEPLAQSRAERRLAQRLFSQWSALRLVWKPRGRLEPPKRRQTTAQA